MHHPIPNCTDSRARRLFAAVAAIAAVTSFAATPPARGDLTPNPDTNTLWIEDFAPFEASVDSRSGWFAFEPEEISVEQVGDRVRFREVSEYAGGSIQRILPLGEPAYRYLQIRLANVENTSHYFKAWVRSSEHGHPQLGRLPQGLGTIDLSAFPFFGALKEMALDLAVIGPSGRAPSGFVEVDWVRLVKSPRGGLTVELVEEGEANGIAEIGDAVVFTYTSDQPAAEPVTVTCRVADDDSPFRFTGQEQVALTDDGQNGDAAAGDGVFTARVVLTPDATELSAKAGAVIATTEVAGEPRNAPLSFGLDILPAAWRAARAAEGIAVGDEILREDFATSEAYNWRAHDDGWSVPRPENANQEEATGLRNLTYDRPRPNGRWIELPVDPQENASLSAGLRPLGGSGSIMLALRFRDPENHYRLRIDAASEIAIDRVCAGWQEPLATTKLKERIATGFTSPASVVTFTVAGSTLLASIDGQPVLHAYDNTFTEGRAALGLNRQNGQFEEVALRSVTLAEPTGDFPWAGVRLRHALRAHDRSFGRDAGTVRIPVTIENESLRKLGPTVVHATLVSRTIHKHLFAEVAVPELAPQTSTKTTLRLDAQRFRSGRHWLVLKLRAGNETIATDAVRIAISKPVPPERMDVFWWGGANIAEQVEDVAEAGVTVMHEFGRRSPELWELGCRLGLTYYSYPPSLGSAPAAIQDAFENPKAGTHAIRVDETDPAFREWAIKTAQSHARSWRSNKRLRYLLLNTEYETRTYPNLSEAAEARYKERLGFARPKEADVPYLAFSPAKSLALFPDRIVPDDAPLYKWYRFFYVEGGGGLNEITSEQAKEVEKIAPDIITLHDPVLRGPHFHGRFDELDLLNHWTYVEQNPLDVMAFADELVCLGRRSNWQQQLSQMIQVIAYADRAMPDHRDDAPDYLRDAPFVAIPPDILTEAVWLAVSRPIDMVAFHGLQTAIETQEKATYRYTNPSTLTALGHVSKSLIQPYGPALRRLKTQVGPRVALLLSAANTMFGRIAEGGGTRSLHNPLTVAGFPVDVVYDEDVQDGALENYAVLAIPQCRFLLRSVRDRIAEFQRQGGTVLLDGDARLELPGAMRLPKSSLDQSATKLEIVPGEVLDLPDSPRARLDADLRLVAAELRKQLLPRLGEKLFVSSPHPYVVLDARRSGDLSYVFAINDRRTTGPYLGQFGAVLEQGVPITASVRFRDAPGALYDAIDRRQLNVAAQDDEGSAVEVGIEGGWGKLLVACAEPLGPARVSFAERAQGDRSVTVQVQAQYASGRAVRGVVPLRFEVLSSDGEPNDYSRFTATAEDGSWTMDFPLADDEPPGTWTVHVTELIGGHKATAHFQVTEVPLAQRVTRTTASVEQVTTWRFDSEAEPRLTLRGKSRLVDEGKSGGCLECFASVGDSKQGAKLAERGEMAPPGAFSVELWLKPKPELADAEFSFLVDCNYYLNTRDDPGANTGYAFFLKRDRDDALRPTVVLGFGDRTETVKAKPVDLEAGTWYQLGFTYNGEGSVRIRLNGSDLGGGSIKDAGPLAASRHALIVGGRVGSSHYGCAGYLDEVKLSVRREGCTG